MTQTALQVVIVDDDRSVCRALERLLHSYGLRAESFFSGEEFLEHLQRTSPHLPDCLILDIQMPGLTGLEVQSRLIRDAPTLPIILITGLETDKLGAEAGVVLRKPCQEDELMQVLRDSIRNGRKRARW